MLDNPAIIAARKSLRRFGFIIVEDITTAARAGNPQLRLILWSLDAWAPTAGLQDSGAGYKQ